ncbi:hypothetical protein V8F20_002471 [Naviculisporaceae sp. PSN 640]
MHFPVIFVTVLLSYLKAVKAAPLAVSAANSGYLPTPDTPNQRFGNEEQLGSHGKPVGELAPLYPLNNLIGA